MRHEHSRSLKRLALPLALAGGLLVGCDQFSPAEVVNPNVTDEAFLRTPNAASTWLRGVERQFLLTVNTLLTNVELASDNYYNNYTTNSKVFDIPRIDYHDADVLAMQLAVARLRETATFGLERALPADTAAPATVEAELLFYRAMASLFAGEHFVALPVTSRGEIGEPAAHLRAALADLARARQLATDPALVDSYTLAMARAHYGLGDREAAVREARALLAANPDFLRAAEYDGVSGPGNAMQGLLTGSTNNYQPLPRLDFLDPKFPRRGPQEESPVYVLKAEEAHLILAEAALAAGDLAETRSRLLRLLELVRSRPTEMVDSRLQKRGRAGGTRIYPDRADTRVAFSRGAPFQEGLTLARQGGPVTVPVVSGTSVDRAQIDAIRTPEEALYLLYLMRQEIFLGEGRRAVDLGIRFPVAFAEVQTNPNAVDGEWYTRARVPAFLPREGGMDAFDFDEASATVVIHHDLNRLLVENRSAPEILPFHD